MGTSDDNGWNSLDSLIIWQHFMIWVFVLCTPLSSDVPVPLQNEPIILSGMKSFVRRRQRKQKHRKKSEKRKMKTKVLIWSCFSYTLSLCSVSSNLSIANNRCPTFSVRSRSRILQEDFIGGLREGADWYQPPNCMLIYLKLTFVCNIAIVLKGTNWNLLCWKLQHDKLGNISTGTLLI